LDNLAGKHLVLLFYLYLLLEQPCATDFYHFILAFDANALCLTTSAFYLVLLSSLSFDFPSSTAH